MNKVPTESIPSFLNKAKIGLAPLPDNQKYRNNIATKIFEYMYYYLPVLSSDLPPEKQFIEGYKNGFLFVSDNPYAFAEKIIELKRDFELATHLGEEGHNCVVNKWNWAFEQDKLLALYEKLLKKINE